MVYWHFGVALQQIKLNSLFDSFELLQSSNESCDNDEVGPFIVGGWVQTSSVVTPTGVGMNRLGQCPGKT